MGRSAGVRRVAAGLAVSLLVLACGSDSGTLDEQADGLADITAEDPQPEPEPDPAPDEPEPEPEADPDPDLDPGPVDDQGPYDGFPIDQPVDDVAVIDEAYVTEVLTQLEVNYHMLVTRILELGTDGFDDDQAKRLSILPELAITTVEDVEGQMVSTVLLFDSEGWLKEDPQPAGVRVEELLSVGTDCISAAVVLDAEELYTVPLSGRWYVGLWPREAMTSEAGTIWRFAARVVDQGEAVDVCA